MGNHGAGTRRTGGDLFDTASRYGPESPPPRFAEWPRHCFEETGSAVGDTRTPAGARPDVGAFGLPDIPRPTGGQGRLGARAAGALRAAGPVLGSGLRGAPS